MVVSIVDTPKACPTSRRTEMAACFSCPSSELTVVGLHPWPPWLQILMRSLDRIKSSLQSPETSSRNKPLLRFSLQFETCFISQNLLLPCADHIDLQSFKQMALNLSFHIFPFCFLLLQTLGIFLLSNVKTDSRQFQIEATVISLFLGNH